MAEYVKAPSDDEIKKETKKPKKISIKKILLIVLGIFILTSIISSISYSLAPKVAVVPISGTIMSEEQTSILSGTTLSSRKIASQLYSLEGDASVEAILLDINSPGGSAVATEEIAKAVEEVKQTKPVYALVNDAGASGAFWIAVTANKTYASPMSTLGSIGVTSAGLSYEEFIEEYNISYRKLTAGEYKDIGSPYREMKPEEKQHLQSILDELHNRFITHISEQRNLSYEHVENYSDGNIFLGSTAKEAGFIDELGYYPDAMDDIKNGSEYLEVEYNTRENPFSLFGVSSSTTILPNARYSSLWFLSS